MKSHAGFRFVPIPMTLNDLERRNSLYFAFFTEFDSFAGRLCHSGWRQPIISVKYCHPVPVFHFRPKLMYPAARSLCDSWASCNTRGSIGSGVKTLTYLKRDLRGSRIVAVDIRNSVVYRFTVLHFKAEMILIIIIIIIILFKSGNKAHKHKQETYRQTDRQYKYKKEKKQYKMYNKTQ